MRSRCGRTVLGCRSRLSAISAVASGDGRPGQLEVDRVAGVVAERLQELEARRAGGGGGVGHVVVEFTRLRPVESGRARRRPPHPRRRDGAAPRRHRPRARQRHRRARHGQGRRGSSPTATSSSRSPSPPPAARCGPRSSATSAPGSGSLPGVTHVTLDWTEMTQEEKSSAMAKARWNVAQRPEDTALPPTTKVVLIASGKGGVGKSSVTVNLAAALAATRPHRRRARRRHLGLLRPAHARRLRSPRRRGARRQEADDPARARGRRRAPADHLDGLPRRGRGAGADVARPDAQPRRQHFLQDVAWGDDLDYLFIDMPPGTGDVQMGVAKLLPARRGASSSPRRRGPPRRWPSAPCRWPARATCASPA